MVTSIWIEKSRFEIEELLDRCCEEGLTAGADLEDFKEDFAEKHSMEEMPTVALDRLLNALRATNDMAYVITVSIPSYTDRLPTTDQFDQWQLTADRFMKDTYWAEEVGLFFYMCTEMREKMLLPLLRHFPSYHEEDPITESQWRTFQAFVERTWKDEMIGKFKNASVS